jgi:hypothetical protein
MIARRFQRFKFLFVLLIAATMLIPSASMATDAGSDLEQRGKQLRKALDNEYQQLAKSRSLKDQNIIGSELIARYIPIGTSFADAAIVLRNANFKIGTTTFKSSYPNLHATAQIKTSLFSKSEIVIDLDPDLPGDINSNIGKIDAMFISTSL